MRVVKGLGTPGSVGGHPPTTRSLRDGVDMPVYGWLGTPKAIYRMAREGGDDWNRLKDGLPLDQRKELSRLIQSIETLTAELMNAKDLGERESSVRSDRRRLRKPWEEARRIALEPPESFVLARELADVLQSESTRKFRKKELAQRLETDVDGPDFLEAVQLSEAAGFAEWTTYGKIRAVSEKRLRALGAEFERLDSSLAKMCARLRLLRVAPLWMLHENGSAQSVPTKFEAVLNQLIPRQDGLKWAGPGIVASASVDLVFVEADQIWPHFVKGERGTADIEHELIQAKKTLKRALSAAAEERRARRKPTESPVEVDEELAQSSA